MIISKFQFLVDIVDMGADASVGTFSYEGTYVCSLVILLLLYIIFFGVISLGHFLDLLNTLLLSKLCS